MGGSIPRKHGVDIVPRRVLWHTGVMVKKKIEAKIKQDPLSVIIMILVLSVLMLGVLVYMHVVQQVHINQLSNDLKQEIELREVR